MDSDDEKEEYHSWRGVPGTIILINVYDSKKSDSAVLSHVSTCRLLRHHLRQANTHYLGVCFYGTRELDASNFNTQNVLEVFPLNLPNLEDFKKLQNIDLSLCSQDKTLIMSDALWHCSKMFANCKKQLVTRTVLILTKFEVPPIESDQDPTFSRVKEMVKSDIEIKFINIASNDYTPHKFYKELLIDATGNHDVILPKPVYDPKEIETLMYKQSHRHLAIAQLMFEIGEGFEIGIGVYSLLKSNFQPKKDYLDRDTNAIVTSVNKTQKVSIEQTPNMSMETDEDETEHKQLPLLKSELIHYQEYGGEKIIFTDKEKKIMTNPFGPPMMKLLGFKPASMLNKEKWYYKASHFLFPNENRVEGSTKAFKALYKACVDTSVVAICVLCTRVNSRPSIVALSPCSHPLGLDIEIGFDIIKIPFMEHVRQLSIYDEDEENIAIPIAHKATMKDVINKLSFDYKPDMFENPVCQSQYRAIEAIALGDEEMEPYIDTTKPDPNKFNDIKEDLFESIFGPFGMIAPKRMAATKESGTTTKRVKTEEIDEEDFQNRLNNKKINTYNVIQLKQILRSKDIPDLKSISVLKKNELVDLVYKHFV
ncbi:unnamed protein product [Diatraea saccharalis]|uniref:Ku domain-containing protein n=1 Tax=Diatraea saccharalis TaxID=40085 RepID=A0A9N9RG33_9NEOP|nr:unnamed protein product [Diatraea saccharalis]